MVDSGDLKSPGRNAVWVRLPPPVLTMTIRTFFRQLQKRFMMYTPLIEVSVSRENLLHNLHTYQRLYPNIRIAPVLKSNAYGHGLELVAHLLDNEDIAFFMVDSLYEARTLRTASIRTRILVMGYVRPQDMVRAPQHNLDFAIVDIEQLRQVASLLSHPLRLHLKIDTGMHRHGIMPRIVPEAIKLLKSNNNLQLVGIGSHFADADSEGLEFSQAQIDAWSMIAPQVSEGFPDLSYRHIAATKGVRFGAITETNIARVGIGLYGFDTSPSGETDVKPVLELRSSITSIRDIETGEFVGYNATYRVSGNARIATVPLGYFEGVDRRLSNKGFMMVQGIACPIVGRVSMNMTSIDVSEVPSARVGDEVIAISRDSNEPNSVSNIVRAISTEEYTETEYVILAHVPQHLRRVVE